MSVYFTKDHEWIRMEGDIAVVGITNYAQEQLGDVVFVEVPDAGTRVDAGGEAAVVESVNAASEVYAPMAGEIVEGNAALADDPSLVNSAPEGDGWFFKMKPDDAAAVNEMLDEAAYKALLADLD